MGSSFVNFNYIMRSVDALLRRHQPESRSLAEIVIWPPCRFLFPGITEILLKPDKCSHLVHIYSHYKVQEASSHLRHQSFQRQGFPPLLCKDGKLGDLVRKFVSTFRENAFSACLTCLILPPSYHIPPWLCVKPRIHFS